MKGSALAGWAALGFTLTSATQLRIAGPLGPGEALLALWMAVFAFLLLRGTRFSYSNAFLPFAVFWTLSAVLLSVGSLVAINLHKQDVESAQHDALAFAFVGPLTCMLAIRLGDPSNQQYYLSLARGLFFTVSAMAFALLVASLAISQLGPISFWYGGGARFRGWSENPNQLALFMLPMPFLGCYLWQRTRGFGRKLAYVLGIGVCAAVGLATQSDALRFAWGSAAGATGALFWIQVIVKGRKSLPVAISYFLVPVVVLVLAVGAGIQITGYLEGVSNEMYERGDQGAERITRWRHGMEAFSYSPLVGFGPGAYSGRYGSFQGGEAHNTFVDWALSTGMLGIALYLGLLVWCAVGAVRWGSPWLLGALITMVADSVFGYSLRQPFFWLMLVLVLALSEQPARQMTSSVKTPQKSTPGASERPAYALTMRRSRREPPTSATRMP